MSAAIANTRCQIHTPRPGNRALQGADEIWPLGHSAQGTPGFSPGGLHCVIIPRHPRFSIDQSSLRTFVKKVLNSQRIRQAEITVVLVGQTLIRRLNRLFLHKNAATDVLAFDLRPKHASGGFLAADIVVSLDAVRRRAREFGIGFREELFRYVLHGILHLTGYDDSTVPKKMRMWKRQEFLLKKLKVIR